MTRPVTSYVFLQCSGVPQQQGPASVASEWSDDDTEEPPCFVRDGTEDLSVLLKELLWNERAATPVVNPRRMAQVVETELRLAAGAAACTDEWAGLS